MSAENAFTRENLNEYLKALAKEFRGAIRSCFGLPMS
jgi:hypothetical protein